MSSSPPRRPVMPVRRLICDLMPCTRCMRTVRIYFRDSTHIVCSQCNHCMSVDEMISRNPELYERWARVRPDERIVLERSSAVRRIGQPPPPSPHPTQLPHGQEMVDSAAGPSSTQANPPQDEEVSSWSIVPTTIDHVVGGFGIPCTSTPPLMPVEVSFLFQLLSRIAIKGASIEALPTVTVTPEHVENERSRSCSVVCHDNLKVGEQVKEIPCKHRFHNDCFVHWFRSQNSCPVCGCQLPEPPMAAVMAHTGGANRVEEAGGRHGGGLDGEAAGRQGESLEGEAAGRQGGGSNDAAAAETRRRFG